MIKRKINEFFKKCKQVKNLIRKLIKTVFIDILFITDNLNNLIIKSTLYT